MDAWAALLVKHEIVTMNVNIAGPTPSGGASSYRNINLLATGQVIKSEPGKLCTVHAWNGHATDARYLKIYDKATAADENNTPKLTVALKALTWTRFDLGLGADFTAGIGVRATTELADNGTTAPGANEITINVTYK